MLLLRFGEDEEGLKAGGRLRCYIDTKRGDLTGSTATSLQEIAPIGGPLANVLFLASAPRPKPEDFNPTWTLVQTDIVQSWLWQGVWVVSPGRLR